MRRLLSSLSLLPLTGVAGILFLSCMASPPGQVLAFDGGKVRAGDADEARRIELLLDELQPSLLTLLPDSRFEDLEVWVQDRPSLYRFPREATSDAEGLWSPTHRRIMLSRNADNVRRTLAHELVHASLGDSWALLPGTLEEGLADLVSAELAEDGSTRLRAGRLSAAALAAGGIDLVLSVQRADDGKARRASRGWSARIKLSGEESDPLAVFQLAAGLSSTKLESGPKRGYYGLAYLVVRRIVERYGYSGLNDLCLAAEEKGHATVPATWMLEAAGLDREAETWRAAAVSGMGADELVELVEMYPSFLVDALTSYLQTLRPDGPTDGWLDQVEVTVSLVGADATVDLGRLHSVQVAVLERLAEPVAVASAGE